MINEIVNGTVLMPNEIDFGDLTPVEVPIKWRGKRYILREPSGAAVKTYQRSGLAGAEMSFNDGNDTRILRNFNGVAGNEASLISQCLYTADKDGHVPLDNNGDADPRHLVAERVIESWPQRVKKQLFEKLEEMCPDLSANETLDWLRKHRAKIDAKIKRLEDAEPKKLSAGGATSSDSLTN